MIFERIPAPLVGRVTSLTTAMCFALMPLGGLLGGVLVSGWGLTVAMLAIGAAYFLVTMSPAVDPAWRAMDDRPALASRAVCPTNVAQVVLGTRPLSRVSRSSRRRAG